MFLFVVEVFNIFQQLCRMLLKFRFGTLVNKQTPSLSKMRCLEFRFDGWVGFVASNQLALCTVLPGHSFLELAARRAHSEIKAEGLG